MGGWQGIFSFFIFLTINVTFFPSFLAGMDFINERLESATDVGAVHKAESSISSVEDDEIMRTIFF